MGLEDWISLGRTWSNRKGAQEQRRAITSARYQIGRNARMGAEEYDRRGQRAINRFDRAGGLADRFVANEPRYSRDFAEESRYMKPTNVQNWYSRYKPGQTVQNQYNYRKQVGYGASPIADRYRERRTSGPTSLKANLGGFELFANAPSKWDAYQKELRGKFGGYTELMSRSRARNSFDPTAETKRFREGLVDTDFTQRTDRLAKDALSRGNDVARMADRKLATETFNPYGGQGSAFMATFDPTKTQGLGDTYKALAAEGPTYEEDFYLSQMKGDNPAFAFARDQTLKDLQKSAAARGGFASGRSLEREQSALTELGAKEFANRGQLANMAGAARRERLGQRLQGAEALDSLVQRGQLAKGEMGLGLDRMALERAQSTDQTRRALAEAQDKYNLDLGMFGDTQNFKLAGLRGELVQSEDRNRLANEDALDRLAGETDRFGLQREQYLGDVIGRGIDDEFRRKEMLGTLYGTESALDLQDRSALDALAGKYGDDVMRREENIDALARGASDEQFRGDELGLRATSAIDDTELGFANFRRGAASDASREALDFGREAFDQAMRHGDATSKIQSAYDMASMGLLTQADLLDLQLQLEAAGIPAAERKAMLDELEGVVRRNQDEATRAIGGQR
jgi:hypothetical protein